MDSAGFCSCTPFYVKVSKGSLVCKKGGKNSTPTALLEMVSAASRRTAAIAASTLLAFSCFNPSLATISAPPCIKGEGPGCEANAAESPLIQGLLEKSRANREKNDKATLERYWKRGYGDYFSFGYNKELKQGEDGKWELEDPEDLFAGAQRLIESLRQKQ